MGERGSVVCVPRGCRLEARIVLVVAQHHPPNRPLALSDRATCISKPINYPIEHDLAINHIRGARGPRSHGVGGILSVAM